MAKRDYYDVLGVPRNASEDQIKQAFRSSAKKHHPDANPGDKGAEDRFKELNEAYEVLGDARKRAAYDRFGHEAVGAGAAGGRGFGGVDPESMGGMGEMFEDLLGGFFGGRGGGRGRRAQAGEDLRYDLELTLDEAAAGGERKITFDRTERCATCHGSGAKAGTSPKACPTCGGRGQVHVSHGFFAISRTCHKCRGRGTVIEHPCPNCHGDGAVKIERTLNVNIPAGVDSGMRVRLAGEGEPGDEGAPRGDLYLVINVHKHELFERDGTDLLLELPIPVPLAAAGGEVDVPTLAGSGQLKIPPGTQTGQVLRLKGFGLPSVERRGSKGDLLVKVIVETPRRLSSRQRELLKEFEKESGPSDYEDVRRFHDRVQRRKK